MVTRTALQKLQVLLQEAVSPQRDALLVLCSQALTAADAAEARLSEQVTEMTALRAELSDAREAAANAEGATREVRGAALELKKRCLAAQEEAKRLRPRVAELEAQVAALEAGRRKPKPLPPPCRVEWCECVSMKRTGLCRMHSQRERLYGHALLLRASAPKGLVLQETGAGTFTVADPANLPAMPAPAAAPDGAAPGKVCSVAWCGQPQHQGRYCNSHRQRHTKYGDALRCRKRTGPTNEYATFREIGPNQFVREEAQP